MSRVLGASEDQVEYVIKLVDTDKSGDIDFREFMAMMSDPKFKDPAKSEQMEVFEMFDKDGNGYISVAELKEAFHKLGGFLVNLLFTRRPHSVVCDSF